MTGIQFQSFYTYIALFFLIYFNVIFEFHISKSKFEIYKNSKDSLPNFLFAVVWKILYCLITVSIFLYGYILSPNSSYYVATMTIYFFFITMCKYWPLVFFQYSYYKFGTIMSFFIFAASIALSALIGSEWNSGVQLRIAFFFFLPINAWTLFACYLSIKFVKNFSK